MHGQRDRGDIAGETEQRRLGSTLRADLRSIRGRQHLLDGQPTIVVDEKDVGESTPHVEGEPESAISGGHP